MSRRDDARDAGGASGRREAPASLSPVPWSTVFRQATPVALSYVPVGLLFGTLAHHGGLTAVQTAAFSLFVYSGAAQLLAVQMLAAGATHVAIALAASILTIRHVLMGASLSLFTGRLPAGRRALLSPLLTDESFALAWRMYRTQPEAHGFFAGTNLYLYLTWNIATLAGFWAGASLPEALSTRLEILFPLLFAAILAGLLTGSKEVLVTLAVFGLLAALRGRLSAEWLVPLGGALAALFGLIVDGREERAPGVSQT